MGLHGRAAGRGVRCNMLCGARASWDAAGRGGVRAAVGCASALAGWQASVFLRGWAGGNVPQATSFPPRLIKGLPQAPGDIRVVLGCGELGGVDSLGMERIGQHVFPCDLRHPPPRWPESAVLC